MTAAPLHIIGLGPGDASLLPPLALTALEGAHTVVGYGLYVDLVPASLLTGKRVVTTGMRHETERCAAAIDAALAGQRTAVVCSGDAGVYGMSGLVLELLEARGLLDTVPVEVIPGIPAVCGAAALLGAPLMHDFACISLSDLLTPWELILRRLDAAFGADFVVALYNPRSRGRQGHLEEALALARRHCAAHTPVGLVRKAYRPDQSVAVCALADFDPALVDMLSLVLVGNSSTKAMGKYMVTPRGYDVRREKTASGSAELCSSRAMVIDTKESRA